MTSTFDRQHCCLLSRRGQMGNRDGSVCVGGMVGGGSSNLVRLILNHTDNSMLSHTPDELRERECVCVSEGVSEGDSWLHRGWDPEKTLYCPLHSSPFSSSSTSPSPTLAMMHSIYLIRAPTLLSRLISAGTQNWR